jgi:SAM-dependent methyltransferase
MFDLVTAFEAYYFWPNLTDDLKEIKRVLKPEGTLLLVNEVYNDDQFEKRNTRWVNLSDMRIHTPNEYKDFLTKAGYHSVEIDNIPQKNWITAIAKKIER